MGRKRGQYKEKHKRKTSKTSQNSTASSMNNENPQGDVMKHNHQYYTWSKKKNAKSVKMERKTLQLYSHQYLDKGPSIIVANCHFYSLKAASTVLCKMHFCSSWF